MVAVAVAAAAAAAASFAAADALASAPTEEICVGGRGAEEGSSAANGTSATSSGASE